MTRGSRVCACVVVSSLPLAACGVSQVAGNPTPVVPPTSGWAVCTAKVLGNIVQGNGQGMVGGPVVPPQPAPIVVGQPPGPGPAPATPVLVSTFVSKVFQWSGSTSGYAAQFDQYVAAQPAPAPTPVPPASVLLPLPPSPSTCDFEATLQQVFATPTFYPLVNWPTGSWPPNSPPQGWGFCFIGPTTAKPKTLYSTSVFEWAGDQNTYSSGFLNYVNMKYNTNASANDETCGFTNAPPPIVSGDQISLTQNKAKSIKVDQVNTNWGG